MVHDDEVMKIQRKVFITITMIVHRSLVASIYHNIYIEYGYRKPKSIHDTFMTLFSFHNETMNIWSHLIGFICVIIAGVNITWDLMYDNGASAVEMFALESYIVCAAVCLFCSTLYHLFMCLSEDCHECLLKLDQSGIALLVTGSFFPGVYYGFFCTPNLQYLYLGLTAVILMVGMATPWLKVRVYGISLTPFIFATMVASGLLPFSHWLLVTPDEFTEQLAMNFVLMFFWYFVGFTVLMLRMPERFFPKSFLATQALPSHAIWHVCVLNAVYVWFHFILKYREVLDNKGCSLYVE